MPQPLCLQTSGAEAGGAELSLPDCLKSELTLNHKFMQAKCPIRVSLWLDSTAVLLTAITRTPAGWPVPLLLCQAAYPALASVQACSSAPARARASTCRRVTKARRPRRQAVLRSGHRSARTPAGRKLGMQTREHRGALHAARPVDPPCRRRGACAPAGYWTPTRWPARGPCRRAGCGQGRRVRVWVLSSLGSCIWVVAVRASRASAAPQHIGVPPGGALLVAGLLSRTGDCAYRATMAPSASCARGAALDSLAPGHSLPQVPCTPYRRSPQCGSTSRRQAGLHQGTPTCGAQQLPCSHVQQPPKCNYPRSLTSQPRTRLPLAEARPRAGRTRWPPRRRPAARWRAGAPSPPPTAGRPRPKA